MLMGIIFSVFPNGYFYALAKKGGRSYIDMTGVMVIVLSYILAGLRSRIAHGLFIANCPEDEIFAGFESGKSGIFPFNVLDGSSVFHF